ncbi:polyprenyl synthetase family protein [Burkholderia metallica]|uniref:polyprenyl synthetase family protein n=1 Tax=Burkholderia metallica TaxID=488729 RepID=UPI001CF5B5A5|nr:polyprenyl synthetase family protein [Burkholderia metallica]MCA8003501.1 polyprenyl synthetase family protein [Burkholderia metallica]
MSEICSKENQNAYIKDRVAYWLERYIELHSFDQFQKNVFRALLRDGPLLAPMNVVNHVVSIEIPVGIFELEGREWVEAKSLLVALTMIESGIYVLDHIMDNELNGELSILPQAAVLTGAIGLISYLPQLVLSEMECDSQVHLAVLAAINNGLSHIAYGQVLDISGNMENAPRPNLVEQSVRGKTGARRGMYAHASAILAGVPSNRTESYKAFGESLGMARQLDSDISDIFVGDQSRDIAAGICTLPFAIYFETAGVSSRNEMLQMIKESPSEPGALIEIRRLLRESQALRKALIRKEYYCSLALHHLERASPGDATSTTLRRLVSDLSWRRHEE